MIILHKKLLPYAGACLLTFLGMMGCVWRFADNRPTWLGNLFSDKALVFLLTPIFLAGVHLIGKTITPTIVTRTQSRLRGMLLELAQMYIFCLLYWTAWFTLAMVCTMAKLGGNALAKGDVLLFLGRYIRYLLGFGVMIDLVVLLKKSNIKALASVSSILVYMFFALELISILPLLDKYTRFDDLRLIFAWMLYGGTAAPVVLGVFLLILTVGLAMAARREELF